MQNIRRQYIDLMEQRQGFLDAANAAMEAGNEEDFDAAMNRATALNPELERLNTLMGEQDRFVPAAPAGAHDGEAEDRGAALKAGDRVSIPVAELMRGLRVKNSTTLATGTIVEPDAAGTVIRGSLDTVISAIIDQVSVVDLSGCGSITEPYVITEPEAQTGKVTKLAGTLRQDSDPTFGAARIQPFEVNVTTYVDRNLSRLTPAAYEERIRNMAISALRRRVCSLITNGDGQSTPDMFGIKNAKNTAGDAIYETLEVSGGITPELLTDIVFAYGSDEYVGGNARLYLTKADLKALGDLRGTNEKKRLFDISFDPGSAGNSGTITDGGLIVPFTINSSLASLSETAAGDAAVQTMLYGDPANYELGLFGDYSVRISEEYKAAERMNTILGDVMVGGNLVVHKGFVVVTVPAAS